MALHIVGLNKHMTLVTWSRGRGEGQERPVCERGVLPHLQCDFVFSRKLDLRRSQVKKQVGISRKESFESSKPTFSNGIKKLQKSDIRN